MSSKREKIRPGLYALVGVTHTRPQYPGGPVCGGQVRAERFPAQKDDDGVIAASWESFCVKCGDCDPNGWDTLAECVREGPEFWRN